MWTRVVIFALLFPRQSNNFEVYITYCENKPKSESFLWTYQHTGGTFFEVRGEGVREGWREGEREGGGRK